MREYKNFKEIDRDLRLLKLQMEIDKEKTILSYHHTKESLAPMRIMKDVAGTVFKSAIVLKAANKVLGMVGKAGQKKDKT